MLLGNPDDIRRVAEQQGVVLNDRVEIIDSAAVRERYVPRLVELRNRITSYNVCYTKLLRLESLHPSPFFSLSPAENAGATISPILA